MKTKLIDFNAHNLSKLAAFVATLSLLIALFFQYQLKYDPCILCIKIRLVAILVVALYIIEMGTKRFANSKVTNILFSGAGMMASAYGILVAIDLYKAENDPYAGCSGMDFDSIWAKLEVWVPWMFEAFGICGKSPELIFGVTMAEGTIALMVALFSLFTFKMTRN